MNALRNNQIVLTTKIGDSSSSVLRVREGAGLRNLLAAYRFQVWTGVSARLIAQQKLRNRPNTFLTASA